ncbi:hypothetical protein UA38_11625 [Photobacterium kishitanii]|uniref:Lipoprotein n=1 Tax=Photobacterium kishitanii TaxID=318456 RepID=A0AAX0YR63_9GAMM|nr:hypothetical protein [Photobacterium kishitanii]KJG57020.1 hypothetical protein UA38_11625 [Photobacterium kishitanii]KJG60544.1 hypothetical protein UA42_14410 [Photobacterium kishitanii]KJG64845.1 hypothetical protein UA40_14100 [Photobacterium kishitanii]KJG68482.1 hypothetical protein UA41_16515 [Photobacterium kishitanii]OBU31234.1 hypothetical protein AYY23_20185 [Photobacterium kishitanii]
MKFKVMCFLFPFLSIIAACSSDESSTEDIADKIQHEVSVKELIAAEPRLAAVYLNNERNDDIVRLADDAIRQDILESAYYINLALAGDRSEILKLKDHYLVRNKYKLFFEPDSYLANNEPEGKFFLVGELIFPPTCDKNLSLVYSELVPIKDDPIGLKLVNSDLGYVVTYSSEKKLQAQLMKSRLLVNFHCS